MNTDTEEPEEKEYAGTCSYCPEDNKIRLFVGRVPREDYLRLKAAGFTSTPKQTCDFVATWTPSRRDLALEFAPCLEDEDQSPEERAADRAERFGGYRDKRLGEAVGHADSYDNKPQYHGFQNYGKAVRAADRHDRIAGRACDAWSKAEYWQQRTAGVISHALYKSTPDVRMGRIKELEAELRRREKCLSDYAERYNRWKRCAALAGGEQKEQFAAQLAYVEHGNYTHPRTGKETYLFAHTKNDGEHADPLNATELCALYFAENSEPAEETEWTTHLKLRLAYENQMLEAQGGRAAFVEMEVGGWLLGGRHLRAEWRQITQVNRSPKTKRITSVIVRDNAPSSVNHWGNPYPDGVTKTLLHEVKTERMHADAYRPPTDEERAEYAAKVTAAKKARASATKAKNAAGEGCPLINPTDEDAERLQTLINERHAAECIRRHGSNAKYYGLEKKGEVQRITQATYSANSKGAYARAETRGLCADCQLEDRASNMYSSGQEEREKARGPALCKVRITGYNPYSIIVITDKPQRALPAAVWQPRQVEELTPA